MSGAIDSSVDSGVKFGHELVKFGGAIAGNDRQALVAARDALVQHIGPASVSTASIIAANFSMLDRIANAIGISVDSMIVKPTAAFRAELGIDSYPSAANTLA